MEPRQTRVENAKLAVLVMFVVAVTASILMINRAVRDRASAVSASGDEKLRTALQAVHRDPKHLSMTMVPGPWQERPMRRANAQIIDPPQVLVLGQSDADHMSSTFFREGVRFYNGFVSNSFFGYQYEVYEQILERGTPELVLLDVRSGYLLSSGVEPAYETPKDDPVWWAGAPKTVTTKTPLKLSEVESLLSLDQTIFTYKTLRREFLETKALVQAEENDGQPYRVVRIDRPSNIHRWLADGSRVYERELDGKLVPVGQTAVWEAAGERHVNRVRLEMLEVYLRRMLVKTPNIVLYAPPVGPLATADGSQLPWLQEFHVAIAALADKLGLDFCGLESKRAEIGCTVEDYYDELHLSRACNAKIVKAMVNGCAPRLGPRLKKLVRPELAQ